MDNCQEGRDDREAKAEQARRGWRGRDGRTFACAGVFLTGSPAARAGAFRVIHIGQKDPLGEIEYPSRYSADKSAVYFTGGGWLYRIGHPSWMHFWVAAMLPGGDEPLFIPDEKGLNPKVLARPIISELGSLALENMPPEKMRLVGIMYRDGYDIYDVESKR